MSTTSLHIRLGSKRHFTQVFNQDSQDAKRDKDTQAKSVTSGLKQIYGAFEQIQSSPKQQKETNYDGLFKMIDDVRVTLKETKKDQVIESVEPDLNEKVSTRSGDSYKASPKLKKRQHKSQAKLSLDLLDQDQPTVPAQLSPEFVQVQNPEPTNWNSNIINLLNSCTSQKSELKQFINKMKEESAEHLRNTPQKPSEGQSNQVQDQIIQGDKNSQGKQIKNQIPIEELKPMLTQTLQILEKVNKYQDSAVKHAGYYFNRQKIRQNTRKLYSQMMGSKIAELNGPAVAKLQELVEQAIESELNSLETKLQMDFTNSFNSLIQSNQL